MTASQSKVIELTYELWVDDGESGKVFREKTTSDSPLTFLFGHGNLLPKFEENLAGKKAGDPFEFVLGFEDGYGDYDETRLVHVPKSVFSANKENSIVPIVGKVIPMRDNQGNTFQAEVVKLEKDQVLMDFNHPMAGFDLHFKGEILSIREATADELAHGHVHGKGGVHH